MARKSIYLGPRLKRMRRELRLTQENMAADLEISPSYVALMERNQRPVTAEMLLKLAITYRVDIADLAEGEAEHSAERLQAAFREPFFSDIDLPAMDIDDIATSYPGFAEALLRLHGAYEQVQRTLAEQRDQGGAPGATLDPVFEARDFLSAAGNYFPRLEESADELAGRLGGLDNLAPHIEREHGLKVQFVPPDTIRGALRFYDFHRRRVMINAWLGQAGQRFQLALQIAMLEQQETIAAILRDAGPMSENGRTLVDQALRSYWAAALVMPYAPFLAAARRQRFDVEGLAAEFDVSFEQAAHRLTTLQRPDAAGVPFFFIRIDPAGNVSKRLDGAGFPFARFGGGCALWNVHDCFAQPGRVLVQRIELPDGQGFASIARTVEVRGRRFGERPAVRAIALACADAHVDQLAYAERLKERPAMPIGIGCRLCHRPQCVARSAPPIGREILSDNFLKTSEPYPFAGD